MFSGIIEEIGEVKNISKYGNVTRIEIKAKNILEDIKIGDSISVNGACLTVINPVRDKTPQVSDGCLRQPVSNGVKKESEILTFEAMPETLKLTNLGALRVADKVNLERSLKIGDRLSGHFVSGHVDCTGIIRKKSYINNNLCFEIAVPTEFIKYCIPRGSIAVDGISLTLVNVRANTFSVYIIPHTLKNTALGFKGSSDKVNIEFDILAKRP